MFEKNKKEGEPMLILESETYGILNLPSGKFVNIRKEFIVQAKKHVILFQLGKDYLTWQYTEKDKRDSDYEKIVKFYRANTVTLKLA